MLKLPSSTDVPSGVTTTSTISVTVVVVVVVLLVVAANVFNVLVEMERAAIANDVNFIFDLLVGKFLFQVSYSLKSECSNQLFERLKQLLAL